MVLDYSQVVYAAVAAHLKEDPTAQVDEGLMRHTILNVIRANKQKHESDWGRLVIACDSPECWRHRIFPYYKKHRKLAREESLVDWKQVYRVGRIVKEELAEFFPYPVIEVPGLEADDVIGILARKADAEGVLILSSDGDFVQLQSWFGSRVRQYDPRPNGKAAWIESPDPVKALLVKVIKGDAGDGVPNVYTRDDYFVTRQKGDRQKPVTPSRFEELARDLPVGKGDPEVVRNYHRNQMLVDLRCTPLHFTRMVEAAFAEQDHKGRAKLFGYFLDKQLRNLLERVNEF